MSFLFTLSTEKNVHNFSLEWPTIFLSAPFSYNYLIFFCVCQISIHYLIILSIVMYYHIKLYTILYIKSSHHNFEDIVNVNRLYLSFEDISSPLHNKTQPGHAVKIPMIIWYHLNNYFFYKAIWSNLHSIPSLVWF